MSVRRLAPDAIQPASFSFTPENAAWAQGVIAKYPEARKASAVIPLLWRAQEQHDYWLPKAAIEYVAGLLGMAKIRVLEVATFLFDVQSRTCRASFRASMRHDTMPVEWRRKKSSTCVKAVSAKSAMFRLMENFHGLKWSALVRVATRPWFKSIMIIMRI